ncbi:MAG: ABC transporter ATP-binding protein [Clostridia bacterium]|nr:ABC transporter ATP-binding protein [Clostridia bacterium]MBR2176139.1 ABC transporter ATP-binding protein [Clostridia bacterium]
MIEINDLTKFYGKGESRFKALDGVSVSINDGEFIVILGASGSGKSTFLNVISGLETADGGTVAYDGQQLDKMSEKELTKFRRENTAYIFQQYYLLPHLNVEKNVRMGADLNNNKDYLKFIEAVGLSEKRKKFPSELSGGEQQRVAIARALAKNPKVLFLDEPTGALDETTGRLVLDYIIKLQKEQCFTMIMVTHNANIAETADKIIRMNSGKIVSVTENTNKKTAYEIGW